MWTVRRLVFLLLVMGIGQASAASDPIATEGLGLPIACIIGQTCWVANYLDLDQTDKVSDFRCRSRTYDGHDGIDIAIRDLAVMAQGVPVLAVAAGTVRSARDGVPDEPVTDEASRQRIAGVECGNGVIIDHEGGWQSQYCHMRQGSLIAKAGQKVRRGTPLGMVGLSGLTQFPHVHLTVSRNKQVIDPFTGQPVTAGCRVEQKPLWSKDQPVPYEEVALYNVGFSAGPPNLEAIRRGQRDDDGPVAATAPALILWVDMFGIEQDDRIQFRVTGPDGKVLFEQEQPVEKHQARRFAFVGKKREANPWPSGSYTGHVRLLRKTAGKEMSHEASKTMTVR